MAGAFDVAGKVNAVVFRRNSTLHPNIFMIYAAAQEVPFFIITETRTREQRKCFKKINAEGRNIKGRKIALPKRRVM